VEGAWAYSQLVRGIRVRYAFRSPRYSQLPPEPIWHRFEVDRGATRARVEGSETRPPRGGYSHGVVHKAKTGELNADRSAWASADVGAAKRGRDGLRSR
jgi:hypothetical protein